MRFSRQLFAHKRPLLLGALGCVLLAGIAVFVLGGGGSSKREGSRHSGQQRAAAPSALAAQSPGAATRAPQRSKAKPPKGSVAGTSKLAPGKTGKLAPRDFLARLRRRGVRVVYLKPIKGGQAGLLGRLFHSETINPRTLAQIKRQPRHKKK